MHKILSQNARVILSWPAHPLRAHSAYAQCAVHTVPPASFVPAAAAANVIIFTKYRESYPTACISNLAANNFNAIFSVFFFLYFLNYYFDSHATCSASAIVRSRPPLTFCKPRERETERYREREGDNNKTCAYEARSDLCLRRNSRQSVNRFVPICRHCCCRKTSWKTKFEN